MRLVHTIQERAKYFSLRHPLNLFSDKNWTAYAFFKHVTGHFWATRNTTPHTKSRQLSQKYAMVTNVAFIVFIFSLIYIDQLLTFVIIHLRWSTHRYQAQEWSGPNMLQVGCTWSFTRSLFFINHACSSSRWNTFHRMSFTSWFQPKTKVTKLGVSRSQHSKSRTDRFHGGR